VILAVFEVLLYLEIIFTYVNEILKLLTYEAVYCDIYPLHMY